MKPINQEQVVQTAQILLAVISDVDGSTPNRYLEGVVSGKSLLRGILSGELVVCSKEGSEDTPQPQGDPKEVGAGDDQAELIKSTPRKRRARKAKAPALEEASSADAAPEVKS